MAVDIVGPIHTAPADCRFAITLIDYYSRWPEIAFSSTVTSATVMTFLATVFSREGNPLELVSDNGSQFVSAEFEAFLADRNIKHCRSSVYYPQANGEIERFNRVFKDCLQTANIEGKPLKPFVTEFLHTYRATAHAVTSVSPSELLHGRPLNTKLHIRGLNSMRPCTDITNLQQNIQKKQEKSKQYTDKRRGAKPPNFQIGSAVRIRKPGIIAKGLSKFTNPLKVVAQKGPATYLLSDGKVWNAFHLAPSSAACAAVPASQPDDACPLPSNQGAEHEPPEPEPELVPSPHQSPRVPRARHAPAWLEDYVT